MNENGKVIIFDTTLRDAEQSPGASLRPEEKMEVARQLAKLNVDVIEAGFPISSDDDFRAVRQIAHEVDGPRICALARALPQDIKKAAEALMGAKNTRIHTFIGMSDIHIEGQLRKTREEVLAMAVRAVQHAKSFCEDVEFSPMDASRTDPSYLYEVIEATINAGATVINIPDTVGYAMPFQFGELIRCIFDIVPNANQATFSVHCHDDLGLAVANALFAVQNGVRQIECTVNGLGERAGNTSLEEVVMILKIRRDYFGLDTGVQTKEIYPTSRMVSRLMGISVQPNKAIVGANAFAHSSGIHQDGVLKTRNTFEIMLPEDVGLQQSQIVLTARSGRHALKHRLSELGYELSSEELERMYQRFLVLAGQKQEVFDEDLVALFGDEIHRTPEIHRLEYLHTLSGTGTIPTATVRIWRDGDDEPIQEVAWGDGPVDATFRAIDKVVGVEVELVDYELHAVTGGPEALGGAIVRIKDGGRVITGYGASTDIIEASAKAYIDALNKLIAV